MIILALKRVNFFSISLTNDEFFFKSCEFLIFSLSLTKSLYNWSLNSKYLLISFIGASCWIISEVNCNEITTYGHVIWHLLFPLGFYQLVLRYDEKITELRQIIY